MTGLTRMPSHASASLRSSAPATAQFISSLQVDSPLIISFLLACFSIHAGVGEEARLRLFSVAKSPELSPSGLFRCVSHIFGHGSWSHLHGNALLLLLVGPPCEAALGAPRLSKIIIWTALASSVSHMALAPGNSVQLGASGVVFALILLNSLLQRQEEKLPLTFVLTAGLWLSRELLAPGGQGVAHSAHLVGAGVGTLFGHRVHVRKMWWGGTRREIRDM